MHDGRLDHDAADLARRYLQDVQHTVEAYRSDIFVPSFCSGDDSDFLLEQMVSSFSL